LGLEHDRHFWPGGDRRRWLDTPRTAGDRAGHGEPDPT
jgi:hypothetical protein